ncbi:unnamed protein product [Cercopithifilaria johnstoni]|uniref:Uncharacterized protein n=1 Tax=Cercopithifilaria johnstoni TaxID=2874296 RepID=A0A8J2PZ77_9BILA|nr:unnamed protein product [Cercopithifilaria johnstoni]
MFASTVKYRKCPYATHYPLQTLQPPDENGMSKNFDVRYIREVDERLGVVVRLYAMVECSMQKIKAEILIEHIRAQILPFDRTFGEHPINNIGNNAQLASFLGTTISTIGRQCSQACRGRKEEMPNIAIIIIRDHLIYCGILGDMVFALLRKNPDSYANRVGSQQYTLFSNCSTSMTMKRSKSVTTGNLINLHIHEMQPSDLRFFVFTKESVRVLLKSVPSLNLFAKTHDEITWLLHLWQAEIYIKNPYEVPAAGFLLVNNLSKLIANNGTRLELNFTEKLLKEEEFQAKEIKKQKRQKMMEKRLEQLNMFKKSDSSTSQYRTYLETELKKIQKAYTRITELINELLNEERNEIIGYMKREEEISNLEMQPEKEQMVLKGKLFTLQQYQKKQLNELQLFLLKVLKYQDIVQCELLININKLEERLQVVSSETNVICVQKAYYDYYRISRITMFQNKIEQNLENLKKQMEETIRDACKTQWKLNTLKSQVQQNKLWTRPVLVQTCWRGGNSVHDFYATTNRRPFCSNGFQQQHWRRRPNSAVFWRNDFNKNN